MASDARLRLLRRPAEGSSRFSIESVTDGGPRRLIGESP